LEQSAEENIGSLKGEETKDWRKLNTEEPHSLYPRSTDWLAEKSEFDSRQGQEILSVQTGFQYNGYRGLFPWG
jgi:hypothetical protein